MRPVHLLGVTYTSKVTAITAQVCSWFCFVFCFFSFLLPQNVHESAWSTVGDCQHLVRMTYWTLLIINSILEEEWMLLGDIAIFHCLVLLAFLWFLICTQILIIWFTSGSVLMYWLLLALTVMFWTKSLLLAAAANLATFVTLNTRASEISELTSEKQAGFGPNNAERT